MTNRLYWLLVICAVLLYVFAVDRAHASIDTFYVTTGGTDAGAGTMGDPWSQETACTTAVVGPGDRVCFGPGTYDAVNPLGDMYDLGLESYDGALKECNVGIRPPTDGKADSVIVYGKWPDSARPLFVAAGIDQVGSNLTDRQWVRVEEMNFKHFEIGMNAECGYHIEWRSCTFDSIGIDRPSGADNFGIFYNAATDSGGLVGMTISTCTLLTSAGRNDWNSLDGTGILLYGGDSVFLLDNYIKPQGNSNGIKVKGQAGALARADCLTPADGPKWLRWYEISGNFVTDCGAGIRLNSQGATSIAFIHHNVITDFVFDGIQIMSAPTAQGLGAGAGNHLRGVFVYNNTIDQSDQSVAAGNGIGQVPGEFVQGMIIANNILYLNPATNWSLRLHHTTWCDWNGASCDDADQNFGNYIIDRTVIGYNLFLTSGSSSDDVVQWWEDSMVENNYTVAEWSSVSGITCDTCGLGAVYGDPLFTDTGSNDFTLQSGSPAEDGGWGATITYIDTFWSPPETVSVTLPTYQGALAPAGATAATPTTISETVIQAGTVIQ